MHFASTGTHHQRAVIMYRFDDPEFVYLVTISFTQRRGENVMGSRPWALTMLEYSIDDGLTGLVGLFGHSQKPSTVQHASRHELKNRL